MVHLLSGACATYFRRIRQQLMLTIRLCSAIVISAVRALPSLQLTAHRSASNALLRVPIGKAYDCSTHAWDVMRCSPCAGAERHIALCLPSQAAGGRGVVSILLQHHGDHADDCGRGSGARGRRPCRPRRGGGAEGHCAGAARQLPTIRKAGTRAQQTPGMNRAIYVFDEPDLKLTVVRIGWPNTRHEKAESGSGPLVLLARLDL
jgi:hypothetical protein